MFHKGVHQFVVSATAHGLKQHQVNWPFGGTKKSTDHRSTSAFSGDRTENGNGFDDILIIREEDLESTYIRSLGVEIMQQNDDGKDFVDQLEKNPVQPNEELSFLDKKPDKNFSKSSKEKISMDGGGLINDPRIQDIVHQKHASEPKTSTSSIPKTDPRLKTVKPKQKPLSTHKPNSVN